MHQYQIIAELPNGQEVIITEHLSFVRGLIENFSACLRKDGAFLISGTKYFWCSAGRTEKLYRMTAYGGYEQGGRGCFYQEIKEE